jgi:hypothetical protein
MDPQPDIPAHVWDALNRLRIYIPGSGEPDPLARLSKQEIDILNRLSAAQPGQSDRLRVAKLATDLARGFTDQQAAIRTGMMYNRFGPQGPHAPGFLNWFWYYLGCYVLGGGILLAVAAIVWLILR